MRLTVSELEKHRHGLILLKLPSQVSRRAPGGCPLRRAGVDHQRQAGVRPEDDQTQDHQEAARVPHRVPACDTASRPVQREGFKARL